MRTPRFSPRSARGFTLIEVMIVVAIIGILSAIAIPNFVKFQARSKQSEAKTNLKTLYTAQKSFFAEKDRFSEIGSEIGFAPERGNRYAYFVGDTGGATENRAAATIPAVATNIISVDTFRFTGSTAVPTAVNAAFVPEAGFAADLGVVNTCPTCAFYAHAAGNADNDALIDTWTIAGFDGTGTAGACAEGGNITEGTPYNSNNDVGCE